MMGYANKRKQSMQLTVHRRPIHCVLRALRESKKTLHIIGTVAHFNGCCRHPLRPVAAINQNN
jgi:hypothetical protein